MTLRAARVNRGLTLKEASEKLGLQQDTLSAYERGITFPRIDTVQRMLMLYEVGIDDLDFGAVKHE